MSDMAALDRFHNEVCIPDGGRCKCPEPSSLSAEDAALVAVLREHQPNVVLDGPGDPYDANRDRERAQWRVKCEGESCGFYRAARGSGARAYREVMDAHVEHQAETLARARADERRRAGEQEAALRERVEAVLRDPFDGAVMSNERFAEGFYEGERIAFDRVRAALAADEPEAAEGGAGGEGVQGA